MNVSQALAERVRHTLPKPTDYALAKALGMNPSNLARVLKGKSQFGERPSLRIAEILHMSYEEIRTYILAESARTDEERKFWEARSPRLQAKVGVALLAALALVNLPWKDAKATWMDAQANSLQAIHYAQ